MAKSGYVVCIEPDGSLKIEAPHNTHCDVSNHHAESFENHNQSSHNTCGINEQHESHEESSSKFIEECFAHCVDVPITVQITPPISPPKAEVSADLAVKKEIFLDQKPKQMLTGMGSPYFLKIFELEKSQKLNIIRTVVLTI